MADKRTVYLVAAWLATLFFLPFLLKPQLLLDRNNDLSEFRESYAFFKREIIKNHHLPLWQNRILSGSPYIGDPQNPLLYPPNYLVLFLPIDSFLLTFFYLHYLVAALFTAKLAKTLGFSNVSSVLAAAGYSLSPVFAGHLEAGHINMLAAFAWFPAYLVGLLLVKQGRLLGSILSGVSLAFIFINYFTISVYAVIAAFGAAFLYLLSRGSCVLYTGIRSPNKKSALKEVLAEFLRLAIAFRNLSTLPIFGLLIFLLISAPQILVAKDYFPLTTRNLIALEDVGPSVVSVRRFIKSLVFPYIDGINLLSAEAVFYPGLMLLALAFYAFLKLKRRHKVVVSILSLAAIFLAFGKKTSLFTFLLERFPILMIFRIPTRHWFVVIMLISLIAGWVLNRSKINFKIKYFMIILIFFESFIFSQKYFGLINVESPPKQIIGPILQEILKEPGYFRIYCPTLCLADVGRFGKGLATGYNPVMLKNYYDFLQKAAGFRFGSYAVSLPPYQTFVDKPQPDSSLMAVLGVKYLASPYEIKDLGFNLLGKENGLFFYKNTKILPRAYVITGVNIKEVKLELDQAGEVEMLVNDKAARLIVNEIYTPFWQAVDQNNQKLETKQYSDIVLDISLHNDVKSVKLKFGSQIVYPLIVISLLTSLSSPALIFMPYLFRRNRTSG